MFWTHIYDLVVKLVVLIGLVLLMAVVSPTGQLAAVLLTACLVVWALAYYFVFRTLGSWLYCRLTLGMDIGVQQAAKLNNALAPLPSGDMQWLPLTEVKDLEEGERYERAIELYEYWREEKDGKRNEQKEVYRNSGTAKKALVLAACGLVVVALVTSYLGLPPASYLPDDTNASTRALVMILPVLGIYKLLEKRLK